MVSVNNFCLIREIYAIFAEKMADSSQLIVSLTLEERKTGCAALVLIVFTQLRARDLCR